MWPICARLLLPRRQNFACLTGKKFCKKYPFCSRIFKIIYRIASSYAIINIQWQRCGKHGSIKCKRSTAMSRNGSGQPTCCSRHSSIGCSGQKVLCAPPRHWQRIPESLRCFGARGMPSSNGTAKCARWITLQPDQQIRLRGAGAEADCLVQSVQRIETQENNGL